MTKLLWLSVAAIATLGVLAVVFLGRAPAASPADPDDSAQVARGQALYARYCAACHGAELQGEPDWQTRKPSGALPAPPHDASGHTWHHSDRQLFEITKHGMGAYAPPGWASDMPAFAGVLSDADIWAVLAYIKSHWPEQARTYQAQRTAADHTERHRHLVQRTPRRSRRCGAADR